MYKANPENFFVQWTVISPLRADVSVNSVHVGSVTINTKAATDGPTTAIVKFRCNRDAWSRGSRQVTANTHVTEIDLRAMSHYAIRSYVDYYEIEAL